MLNQISRKTKINSGIIASAVIVIVAIATIIAWMKTQISLLNLKYICLGCNKNIIN